MIKDILDKLPEEQRKQLMHAFEHEFAQYVELPDGKFIGVNVTPVQHLRIRESAGNWHYGDVMKGDKDAGVRGEEG